MRRLLTWIVVTLGIAAVARKLRRRGQPPETPTREDDPADELRQKLAESRAEEPPPAEPEPPVTTEASVEDRRSEVHEQGRSALDEMRGSNDT
jgi:hypothetical protein